MAVTGYWIRVGMTCELGDFKRVEVFTKTLNYRFTATWICKLAIKSSDRCNGVHLLRQCVSTHRNCLIPHTCLTLFVFDILFVDGEIFYLTIILFLECIHSFVSYIVPPNTMEKQAGILRTNSFWGAIAQSDDLLMAHFDLACFQGLSSLWAVRVRIDHSNFRGKQNSFIFFLRHN